MAGPLPTLITTPVSFTAAKVNTFPVNEESRWPTFTPQDVNLKLQTSTAEPTYLPPIASVFDQNPPTSNQMRQDSRIMATPDPAAPATGGVKRKLGGRPKSSAPKRYKSNGPTKLRKGREVETKLSMDVWELILSFCPSTFLFRARQINKSFHRALIYESAWKKNRIQNNGEDMPNPLPGMKEWDYVNLLEGLGCMDCKNPKTRKCYWAFQKRWCKECLAKNTMKGSTTGNVIDKYPQLSNCIPHAVVDSWGNYESAGSYQRDWQRVGHGQHKIFLNTAVTKVVKELEDFLANTTAENEERTEEDMNKWYEAKEVENHELMKKIQEIENWDEKTKRDKISKGAQHKADRIIYFQEKAMSMTPPLGPAALDLIPAYKRSIDISRPPNDRSWKALLPKLEKERVAAEEAVATELRLRTELEESLKLKRRYESILSRRRDMDTPDQQALLRLADEVLEELREERCLGKIADEDLALVVLRNVRSKYYDIVQQTASGVRGGYRLLIDDARMVFEMKILPIISAWDDQGRSKKAQLFKCPGCARSDVQMRYNFKALFAHLKSKHSYELGDFRIFHRNHLPLGVDFPYCDVEWPVNLPILAEHHVATGKWNPDDDSPYERAPLATRHMGPVISVFERRHVNLDSGYPGAEFIDNIMHVAKLLHGTRLGSKYQTQIALRFAAAKYSDFTKTRLSPPMECFEELRLALIRGEYFYLFDQFRCGACSASDNNPRLSKFANRGHQLAELVHHYRWTHEPDRWTRDMMVMPSETELWHALTAPGMEGALEAFEGLFILDGAKGN
ncbi:MAG: hypothetical protein M1827_000742 [Pycnora praestabilis]|nr:MAG: hypothetical protein M1827_000742 [Pycnora praestabilis]